MKDKAILNERCAQMRTLGHLYRVKINGDIVTVNKISSIEKKE